MRNPTHDLGGFWLSYSVGGRTVRAKATEKETFSSPVVHRNGRSVVVAYDHLPDGHKDPVVHLDIELTSEGGPVLLLEPTLTNVSDETVSDARLYFFVDFDLGGPNGHADDRAWYDRTTGIMSVHDPTPLHVALISDPKADSWDVTLSLIHI